MIKIFALLGPTIIVGMIIRATSLNFAIQTKKAVNIGALLFLVALIVAVTIKEKVLIANESLRVGPVCLALIIATSFIKNEVITITHAV